MKKNIKPLNISAKKNVPKEKDSHTHTEEKTKVLKFKEISETTFLFRHHGRKNNI